MDAATLNDAIAEVCPVISCSVGVADDRTTWSFDPSEGATDDEKAAGQNVIDTIPVDYKPPPVPDPQTTTLYDHENRLRSMEGQPPLSIAEFLVEVKSKTMDKVQPQPAQAKPKVR